MAAIPEAIYIIMHQSISVVLMNATSLCGYLLHTGKAQGFFALNISSFLGHLHLLPPKILLQVRLDITSFCGHLHPLIVHLPIGILLIALLFQYLSGKERYADLSSSVSFLLGAGMLSAIASCITGYLLSLDDGYDTTTVNLHMWMGIGVAIISAFIYILRKRSRYGIAYKTMSVCLLIFIIVTGHLGGSLTHGNDYLGPDILYSSIPSTSKRKFIPDMQQAVVYTDLVQPLLADKCYGCHGTRKQKGRLRMDQPDMLLKGGKHGPAIQPGNVDRSELIKRVLLPLEDEHHMAPKEKPQLSRQEISLLSWWIRAGAPFGKKVSELALPDSIKRVLLSLQNIQDAGNDVSGSDLPTEPVPAGDKKAITLLRRRGAIVLPVAQNSHYLEVNFMKDASIKDRDMLLLIPLQQQLFSLKLNHTSITDSALHIISSCKNLGRLHADHTAITDEGLSSLTTLSHLQYVHLTGTGITEAGVEKLRVLKQLKTLYLYQTRVNRKKWPQLQTSFLNVHLDSGAYAVPLLTTDTIIVKPVIKK